MTVQVDKISPGKPGLSLLHTVMYTLKKTVPSNVPVVSVADLKLHDRTPDSSEDALLTKWIAAASNLFESSTGYPLLDSTWKLTLDNFPCGRVLYVPLANVTEVTAEYLDPEAVWQELEVSTDLDSVPARIVLPSSLPTFHPERLAVVRVTIQAGHAEPDEVPEEIRQAIAMLAAHYYRQRSAFDEVEPKAVPMGWQLVCDHYRHGITGDWNA